MVGLKDLSGGHIFFGSFVVDKDFAMDLTANMGLMVHDRWAQKIAVVGMINKNSTFMIHRINKKNHNILGKKMRILKSLHVHGAISP